VNEELVPIALVPVEVFGGDCACHEKHGEGQREDCPGWGYGLSDAVSAWSDCNRADNRIYRVDDTDPKYREPGETVIVYVPRGSVPWFEKHWGEGAQQRAEVEAAQEQVVASMLGRAPIDTVSVKVDPPETLVATLIGGPANGRAVPLQGSPEAIHVPCAVPNPRFKIGEDGEPVDYSQPPFLGYENAVYVRSAAGDYEYREAS
jgi:hypothetical protein